MYQSRSNGKMTMPFLCASVEGGSFRVIAEAAWVMMIIFGAMLSSPITHKVFPSLLSDHRFPLFLASPIHFSSALLRLGDDKDCVVKTLSSEHRGGCFYVRADFLLPLKKQTYRLIIYHFTNIKTY